MDSVKTWLISYNFSDDKECSWDDIMATVKRGLFLCPLVV